MNPLLPLLGISCLTAAPAWASGNGHVDAWSYRAGYRATVRTELSGNPLQPFGLFSTDMSVTSFDLAQAAMLGHGAFDAAGHATMNLSVPDVRTLPQNTGMRIWLVTRGVAGLDAVSTGLPLSGTGGTLCQDFDPDYKLGVIEPVAGEVVDNQWAEVNMTVSAVNATVGHPDTAVIFDSANPTGGDTDLATPGTGPGNDTALGQLIIIAENDVDANSDGLIDEPDDEEHGGVIRFDFSEPYRMCSATLVDIDDGVQSELRFYIGNAMTLETIPVVDLGDNSVQTITFDKRDVRRFEVALGGSGGIAHLGMVPCPMGINFDETPFGRPYNYAAGTWIDDEFLGLGLTVSTMNAAPGHPDKAILFDSENPTGEDFDLMTPGTGINNTEALGKVLIIAEDDVDANMDGLVDDPDDEEFGGQITLEFSEAITFFSTKVLDVDGMERDVFTFFDENDNLLDLVDIGSLGDNSVQTLTTLQPVSGIRKIVVNLTGSGALARLRWCPDSNVSAPQP